MKKSNWLKIKVRNHWDFFGKAKVFIHRNYMKKEVTIDFMNGGSCSTYNYDGKWIVG